MHLNIKVISGSRKGTIITLDPFSTDKAALQYILETEAIEFHLVTDEVFDKATIIVEDYRISLVPRLDSDQKIIGYYASPQFKSGRWDALFYNYFGIAVFYLETDIDSESSITEFGKIDVLARKASVEQVESMVKFVVSIGEEELLRANGATRRAADQSRTADRTPKKLIEQLDKNLHELENALPYIVHSPISTLSSKLASVTPRGNVDIQEQGISWLIENLSVLQETNEVDLTILNLQGKKLTASTLHAPVMYENTDVYENRILLGYIDSLINFISELVDGINEFEKGTELNTHEGYLSFFSSIVTKIFNKESSQLGRVKNIRNRARLIRRTIANRLRLTKSDMSLPKFTPKVQANRYYSVLFRTIHNWYQNNTINWNSQKILLAINNIPKLFELYSVLVTSRWLSLNGIESNDKKQLPFWKGEVWGLQINFWYEPTYWSPGHIKTNGDIFASQNKTLLTAISDKPGKIRAGRFAKRIPDLVLEVVNSNGEKNLIVLDSKYTNAKLAFEYHLPDCIIKYVHGISSKANPSVVKAMFILFPDKSSEYSFLDFHAYPFNMEQDTRQLPMLGAQGLSLGANETEHTEQIGRLLTNTLLTFK